MGGHMEKDKKKSLIVLIVSILIIVLVLIGGAIISKNKAKELEKKDSTKVDVTDVGNVSIVDEKLKQGDYRVSQSYLLNYTKRKGSVWYSSKGVITKIKNNDNNAIITIADEKNKDNKIKDNIDKDNLDVKVNDLVYFVGTIDLSDGYINLARISKDVINYSNVEEIELNDLVDNIYYLKNTYVLVSGYMITVGDKYKLYESKAAYKKDEEIGNYFFIEWNGKFNYTGTQDVLLKCFIGDRYKLIGCELEK